MELQTPLGVEKNGTRWDLPCKKEKGISLEDYKSSRLIPFGISICVFVTS